MKYGARRVLAAALRRSNGFVLPTPLEGAAEQAVVKSLRRGGFITDDAVPVITDKGRAVVADACPERGDGEPHEYTPDIEYDATGKTVNCMFCGEEQPAVQKTKAPPNKAGSVVLRRQLINRTIVNIRMNPFDNGRGGQAMNFEIVLDNGKSIFFDVEETESDYGTYPRVVDTQYTKGSKR